MSWSKYAEFLAFAVVLVLIPGPDFAVVTKNTLVGGRQRGRWTALGVSSSNLVQGTAAAFGVSALIVRVQPLFEAVKWAGVGYLAYLGVQAIRSALRGRYQPMDEADSGAKARSLVGWRQGFISNITNPKVLVFYLAVLPQFLTPGAGLEPRGARPELPAGAGHRPVRCPAPADAAPGSSQPRRHHRRRTPRLQRQARHRARLGVARRLPDCHESGVVHIRMCTTPHSYLLAWCLRDQG